MLKDLITSFIYKRNGWAVAEQFEETFNSGDFESQNPNALEDIQDTLRSIDTSVLSENSIEELNEYNERLKEYLKEYFEN